MAADSIVYIIPGRKRNLKLRGRIPGTNEVLGKLKDNKFGTLFEQLDFLRMYKKITHLSWFRAIFSYARNPKHSFSNLVEIQL